MRRRSEIGPHLAEVRALLRQSREIDAESDPGVWFVVGQEEVLADALGRPSDDLADLEAADRAVFARTVFGHAGQSPAEAVAADEIVRELTGLDELPSANADPDVNYLYGRLAAFQWLDPEGDQAS